MLPVSAEFLAAVRGSHGVVSQALLLTPPGVTGTNLIGRKLDIVDGSITLDGTANIRGTFDITVKAPWPTGNSTQDLVPYGTEIAISRGIQFGNGSSQSAPLGIFRLTSVEQADAPKGVLHLSGSDRMTVIIDAKLLVPVYVPSAATAGAVMSTLVQGGTIGGVAVGGPLPGAVIQWLNADGTTDAVTPATVVGRNLTAEQDRFQFLNDMVTGLGRVWYFDYRGILVIKPVPTPSVPTWTADAGPNGVLTGVSRNLTRQNVYNAVVVVGEAIDSLSPPSFTLPDNDPTSVTYFFGPFGQVPLFYSNPVITNNSQALVTAQGLLQQNKGLPYDVNFTQVPNPALEPFDRIQLVYPIDLTATPHQKIETHYLQQVVIGLGSQTGMTAATRLTSNSGVLN